MGTRAYVWLKPWRLVLDESRARVPITAVAASAAAAAAATASAAAAFVIILTYIDTRCPIDVARQCLCMVAEPGESLDSS